MTTPELTFNTLQAEQEAYLQQMRNWVCQNEGVPVGAAGKLDQVQAWIDGGSLKRSDRWKLDALSVVFGDALVQVCEGRLSWVYVVDASGPTFALRWQQSDVLIYPLDAIGGRLADSEVVDLRAVFVEYTNLLPVILR